VEKPVNSALYGFISGFVAALPIGLVVGVWFAQREERRARTFTKAEGKS
jgi:hypothetical protein